MSAGEGGAAIFAAMATRRIGIAAVLLVAFGLLGWWGLGDGLLGGDAGSTAPAATTAQGAPAVGPAVETPGEAGVVRELAGSVVGASASGAWAEVRDAHQQPVAGIPVCAWIVWEREPGGAPARRHALARSDGRGRVDLARLQDVVPHIASRGDVRPAVLGLDLPGFQGSVPIDAARPPHEPVVLYLPATGAIDVIALDAIGRPRAELGVGLGGDPRVEGEAAFGARTDAQGRATFAHVALGKRWRIGTGGWPEWQVFEGPVAANERVSVRLQPPPGPVLRGRLLRDQVPVASTDVRVEVDGQSAWWEKESTDAEGRFRMPLNPELLGRACERIEVLVLRTQEEGASERARWRGSHTWSVAEFDIGDVQLAALPLLVAGRLVGADGGAPPESARIQIQVASAQGGDPWQWFRASGGAQLPTGEFRMLGEAPSHPLRLVVYGRGFVPVAPRPFVAGERDVRIELQRGGSVVAKVTVLSPIQAQALESVLVPQVPSALYTPTVPFDPSFDPRVPGQRQFVSDGPLQSRWVWPEVAPGRYRLEVHSRGLHRPVATVDDIVVVEGERNESPRLQLDLSGLPVVELRVPQAANSPADAACGVVAVLEGDTVGPRFVQLDGPLAWFVAATPIDLRVRVPGCRDRIVRGAVGVQQVDLEPGIPMALQIEGAPTGVEIEWSVTPLDDPLALPRATIYSPAAGGSLGTPFYLAPQLRGDARGSSVVFALPIPGRYRVAAKERGQSRTFACEPATIDVPSAGGTFAIHVR